MYKNTHRRKKKYKNKNKISVPRPLMIVEYNKYMDSTNFMDQNISKYKTGIRGNKSGGDLYLHG